MEQYQNLIEELWLFYLKEDIFKFPYDDLKEIEKDLESEFLK